MPWAKTSSAGHHTRSAAPRDPLRFRTRRGIFAGERRPLRSAPVKRFLPHEELARDRRFKRSKSRNELFRTLPDDVTTIVRVLEEVAPKLRERVEGTALEAVFDDLGPGFMFLTTAAGTASTTERTPLQLRAQLHGIFVGELQALEAASRTLFDFPDAPWEFKMNMARQSWDEARHVQIFEKLIDHVDGAIGEFPRTPSSTRRPAPKIRSCVSPA